CPARRSSDLVGQGLRLAAGERTLLERRAVRHGLYLGAEMLEGLDQEAAGAGGWVEHGLAETWVGHRHHEAHHGARRVKLAGVPRGVPHLAQEGFIKGAESVQLLARGEMDARNLVDDVPQQVAALHAVVDAAEDSGNHVAAV